MKKRRELLITVIGIFLLISIVAGASFAIYSFSATGTKENVIRTGNITIDFINETQLLINDMFPMPDSQGISEGRALTFDVVSTLNGTGDINYAIGLYDIAEGNTLTEEYIKIYVLKDGLPVSGFTVNEGKTIASFNEYFVPSGLADHAIYADSFAVGGVHHYTIIAWIADNYELPNDDISNTESNGEIEHKVETIQETFSFKVKVYGSDGAVVVTNDVTRPVCTWGNVPSTSNINNGGTSTYTLTCTDEEGLSDSDLTLTEVQYRTRTEQEAYSEWSDWTTTSCDTSNSNLCESLSVYRSRTNTGYGNWSDYSTSECSETSTINCEGPTNGYKIEQREENGTENCNEHSCSSTYPCNYASTCTSMSYNVYCNYMSCDDGTSWSGWKYGTNSCGYASCTTAYANGAATIGTVSYYNNYCVQSTCPSGGTLSGTTCMKNCTATTSCFDTCATFGATTTTYGTECIPATVGGTYYNNSAWTTQCTNDDSLYRTREKLYSNWTNYVPTACDTSNSNLCENITGYRTRIEQTAYSEWSNWTTTECDTSDSDTCETRTISKDLQLTTSGTAAASITNIAKQAITNGYTYILTITGGVGEGQIGITVNSDAVKDFGQNGNIEKIALTPIILDNSGPTCIWTSGPSLATINSLSTATYVLTCTDANGFNDSDIVSTDFTIGGTPGAINITNITKSTITNGYTYTITVSGTSIDGTSSLQLKTNSVTDGTLNGNIITSTSNIVTVQNGVYATNMFVDGMLTSGNPSTAAWNSSNTPMVLQTDANGSYIMFGRNSSNNGFGGPKLTGPLTIGHVYYWKQQTSSPWGYSFTCGGTTLSNASTEAVYSQVFTATTIGYLSNTYYICYASHNAGGFFNWRKGMMIDLTATYGSGNEPDVVWCDANIGWFGGTELIPNY